MRLSKDQVAASATPMVLLVLAAGEDYGYSILRHISRASAGEIEWSEGLLYPLLHRLERLGLVTARWGRSDSGRRRKYYALTPDGRRELEVQTAQWRVITTTLRMLDPPPPTEFPRPDPSPPVLSRPDPSSPELPRPDPSSPELSRPDPSPPELPRADLAHADPTGPDPAGSSPPVPDP